MTAKNQNFEMYAGDSKNIIVTVTDNSGLSVNLTGFTVKWRITYQSGVVNKDTTTGGVQLTNPAAGVFTIFLLPADTAGKQGGFIHGAELIDGSGNVSTLLSGLVIVNSAVV